MQVNILTKFEKDWAINMAPSVVTKFSKIWSSDLRFDTTWPSYELNWYFMQVNILTKFDEDWMAPNVFTSFFEHFT